MTIIDRIAKGIIAFAIALGVYGVLWFTVATHPQCRNPETWLTCVVLGEGD